MYWCLDNNVPLLRRVPDCVKLVKVEYTEPGDPRPAIGADIEATRRAIINEEASDELARLLVPGDEPILLNKIPGYGDQADEIIVRGAVVGHRFFDVEARRWRFRPLGPAVAEMVNRRIGWWAIVNRPKLARGYTVHRSDIVASELPEQKYTHVAVQTLDGRWQGVAKLFRGGRLYIVKAWRSVDGLPEAPRSTMRDVVKANEEFVVRDSERVGKLVLDAVNRYSKPVVVSYSGGKDSLAILDIVDRLGIDYAILFNDTGLEPVETYENLEEVKRRYRGELIIASAGDRFWKALNEFYVPSRDYRWCCKVIKLGPITEVIKRRFPQGVISVVGQRSRESFQRARLPPIAPSRWVAGSIVVAPIHDWTALEVWLYILWRNLPINKAYLRGFDRLGCVVCPANELAELELVKEAYPKHYNRLITHVKAIGGRYAEELGLWRWRSDVPGDLAKRVRVRLKPLPTPIRARLMGGSSVLIEADREVRWDTLSEFLKMLGRVRAEDDHIIVEGRRGWARIGKDLRIDASSQDLAIDAAAMVARATVCGDCQLCVNWCPTGALVKLSGHLNYVVKEDKCVQCLRCSMACPSAQYLVYRPLGAEPLKGVVKRREEGDLG